MKFKVITLGCKVNRSESDAISNQLEVGGWLAAEVDETADVYIINTCAVTQKASQQSRQLVRHTLRHNPTARILVSGCAAQVEADAFRKISGVSDVISQEQKPSIPKRLLQSKHVKDTHRLSAKAADGRFSFAAPTDRTRPFLKIQDGCDAFCTYCIVPYARGRSQSMHPDAVIDTIRRLKDAGFREVVLSGVHLGRYGTDLDAGRTRLFDLLKRIDADGIIDRVRLSSIEPLELTEDIIHLVASSPTICPHFHIPLQSGDDAVLKQMNRPYSTAQYRNLALTIHEHIPDAAIGADVLAGFPGETDKAFQNTCSLIETLPVSYLHVFPFSPRTGTPASEYPHQVPPDVKRIRCQLARRLGTRLKNAFYRKYLGNSLDVLIEETRDSETGKLKGLTPNYITVLADGPDTMQNTIVTVTLDRLHGNNAVIGKIKS